MNIKEFKKDLKEVLAKHKASISFSVSDCSDTHGLCDEQMVVDIGGLEWYLSYGWEVSKGDL